MPPSEMLDQARKCDVVEKAFGNQELPYSCRKTLRTCEQRGAFHTRCIGALAMSRKDEVVED